MPTALTVKCKVISSVWLTPTVLQIRFLANRKINHIPGQFLSLIIPDPAGGSRPIRRIYSLSAPVEAIEGYELCVKNMGGPGTKFLTSLKIGDEFKASAPYGDFVYETKPERNACFIATGTGIGPLKAIAFSKQFQECRPAGALLVFGARTDDEVIYPGMFETQGFRVVNAISQAGPDTKNFRGRVTDFLRTLPLDWAWHSTDFYLCGNGEMIGEVRRLLHGHSVLNSSVFQEVYFTTSIAPEAEETAVQTGEQKTKAA